MTDEALHSLKSLRFAQPSPEAKKLALNAAMLAFDAAQASRKKAAAPKGFFSNWKLGAGIGVPHHQRREGRIVGCRRLIHPGDGFERIVAEALHHLAREAGADGALVIGA